MDRHWSIDARALAEWLSLVLIPGYVLWAIATWPLFDWLFRQVDLAVSIGHYRDFSAYYLAGDRALACLDAGAWHCESLYRESASVHRLADLPVDRVNRFVYPPAVAVLFVPLSIVPYSIAAPLWSAGGLVALWAGLVAVVAQLVDGRLPRWVSVALGIGVIGWQPTLYAFKQGQVTPYLGAVLCLALVAAERARRGAGDPATESRRARVLTGALTALPAAVKPIYAPACAPLLRDRYRLLGGCCSVVGMLVASLLAFGPGGLAGYVEQLQYGKGWGIGMAPLSRWHGGFFEPLGALGAISLPVRGLLLVATIALALVVYHRRRPTAAVDRSVFAIGLLVIPIAAPEAYTLEFILLLPAVALLWWMAWIRGGAVVLPIVALFLLHIQAYSALFVRTAIPWLRSVYPVLQPGLWGLGLLLGLATYRAITASRVRGRGTA